MSLHTKQRLAVAAAALTVLGGSAGTALACHGPGPDTTSATQLSFTTAHHLGMWRSNWLGSAVTSYLGLQPAQIKADLRAGQTLAQIANATPGKSASGLVSAIMAAVKTKLDTAVSANKLSATTESTILTNLNDKVTAIVNGQWHWWWPVRHHLGFHV
jgi:hypothetical protein